VIPARDTFHDKVRTALEKDGWTITHDPLVLTLGPRTYFVDLAAERLIAAERGDRYIAVEVKSFLGESLTADLEMALGQFALYRAVLAVREPERMLFLALPEDVRQKILSEPLGDVLLAQNVVRFVGFDVEREVITGWTP
jgi:hypothetical protein